MPVGLFGVSFFLCNDQAAVQERESAMRAQEVDLFMRSEGAAQDSAGGGHSPRSSPRRSAKGRHSPFGGGGGVVLVGDALDGVEALVEQYQVRH